MLELAPVGRRLLRALNGVFVPGLEISPFQDNSVAGTMRTVPGMNEWSQTLFEKLLKVLDCAIVLVSLLSDRFGSQLCLAEDPFDETNGC